jgi:putative hemolysin
VDLLLLVALLLLSALFSAAETAFFSLRQTELAELARRGADGRGVVSLVRQPRRLLPALLIGNLLVNTGASVAGTAALIDRFGPSGVVLAVPTITLLLLLGGEITPKLIAMRYRRPVALALRPVLAGWLVVIKPVLDVIAGGTARLLDLLPGVGPGSRPFTPAELETACEIAVEDGALSETEGRFLARLLVLQRLEARQIMTPRTAVVALERGLDRAEILRVARATGFNRYPVTEPGRAHPIGFFHLKDLLADTDAARPLEAGLRPPLFAPESKQVAALLTVLRTGGVHLAMIVDEHGDFTGIVTLDDCLRALTGPIGGESDRVDPEAFQIGEAAWIVSGRLDLRAVNEACGTTLELSPEYVTIAGLLMTRLGRIARRGDRVREGGARFTVVDMSGPGITRVRVDLPAAGAGGRV